MTHSMLLRLLGDSGRLTLFNRRQWQLAYRGTKSRVNARTVKALEARLLIEREARVWPMEYWRLTPLGVATAKTHD